MANCNCLKNPHYKSSAQFYNTAAQTIGSAAAALNLLGSEVTDTGASVKVLPEAIEIEHGGLYQIEFAVNINATAAGEVSLQMAKNGIPLQETKRSQTLAVGDAVMETGTVRYLATCCCQEPTRIQLLINAEGAAAGTVNLVSGCIVKLA